MFPSHEHDAVGCSKSRNQCRLVADGKSDIRLKAHSSGKRLNRLFRPNAMKSTGSSSKSSSTACLKNSQPITCAT